MGPMRAPYWEQVAASGFAVPDDAPLAELTTELTVMLGSTDPHLRERLAAVTLRRWLEEGVYDELLGGLGDGMAAGLLVGLGEDGTDTVFRRSWSAALLAACLDRDNVVSAVGPDAVLRWGDQLLSWFVRERDLRALVPGQGAADSLVHGADALVSLVGASTMGELELMAVLDVVADRLAVATAYRWSHREVDRVAGAVMAVLRRDRVEPEVIDAWLDRLVQTAGVTGPEGGPAPMAANAEGVLRSLHLQLALSARAPAARGDLLLSVLTALRRTNADSLR